MSDEAPALRAVAALSDELRRRMFEYIRRAPAPVTRDEAAGSVGISRKLAAFHLDKLVAVGLLRAGYDRPGGTRRVGRSPKVYRPTGLDVNVSIPRREHGLLAEILLDGVRLQAPGETAREGAIRAAAERGRAFGTVERDRLPPGRLDPEHALTCAGDTLERHGFDPQRVSPSLVRLANCPFQPLSARNPDLVCRVNHALLGGLLDGLEASGVSATRVPRPGMCCVEMGIPAPGPQAGPRA
ncbi:helix-turn-helix transcriptional regulator [Actinomadura oligospora]|uniref:helix-turn-helix transcriptional regulator n=1 Tax=Actinomadura oligospora TaxID=111804 RepID=UPI00047D8485|nr:transcriptional regulator [Actinomadura oligospora]